MAASRRPRGKYAKLICWHCRDRRVKCLLPDGAEPSEYPQQPATSCRRCRQKGLECVVDFTKLGRPNVKRSPVKDSSASVSEEPGADRSPSPYLEDLILNNPDGDPSRRAATLPAGLKKDDLMQAIYTTFDLGSALITRDKHFAKSLSEYSGTSPADVERLVSPEVASLLDEHLVWHRIYCPYIPTLAFLRTELGQRDSSYGAGQSIVLLFALLCTLALDIPAPALGPHRHLQLHLDCIVYHAGQKVLFRLPKHEYTLTALELVMEYKPLAFMEGPEPARNALGGQLYSTLGKAVAMQLELNRVHAQLQQCLRSRRYDPGHVHRLVYDAMRWATWCVMDAGLDEPQNDAVNDSLAIFETLSDISETEQMPVEALFHFIRLRCELDDLVSLQKVTREWKSVQSLAAIVKAHRDTQATRRAHFENAISKRIANGLGEEVLAATRQLLDTELFQSHANVNGLAMFYAMMDGRQMLADGEGAAKAEAAPHADVYRYLKKQADCGGEAAAGMREFLANFGETRMAVLEEKISRFNTNCETASIRGIRWTAPRRLTATNLIFTCKDIAEFNAYYVKTTGRLHDRIDAQLSSLLTTARNLDEMEVLGGRPEALQRGSLWAATAKLVRGLHRVLTIWKTRCLVNPSRESESQMSGPPTSSDASLQHLRDSASLGTIDMDLTDAGLDIQLMDSSMPLQDFTTDWGQMLFDDFDWQKMLAGLDSEQMYGVDLNLGLQ